MLKRIALAVVFVSGVAFAGVSVAKAQSGTKIMKPSTTVVPHGICPSKNC